MVFIGMDHGTTGISFCIMSDDGEVVDVFKIGREESKQGKVSAIEELSKRVDLESIDLMAVTYAMGDGINKIQNIDQVKNRGILSINGAGKVTGGGTSVFSEIEDSKILIHWINYLEQLTLIRPVQRKLAYAIMLF